MQLTITHQSDSLLAQTTGPTAVEPGRRFNHAIKLISEVPLNIHSIEFELPEYVELSANPFQELLPYELQANQPLATEVEFKTITEQETFGLIKARVKFSQASQTSETQELLWEQWISVFTRVLASYPEPLSDELRRRLIAVTNFYLRNAHIFMANFVAYFSDYLNIEIDTNAAAAIAEELPFATQGLPLDDESYLAMAQGILAFYGISDWKFEAEESCEELDPLFQATGVQDIETGEVEVSS